jgi:hypothetical protein
MKDPLPIPDQLEKQLSKCKTVRDADVYCKSRDKTKEVRVERTRRSASLVLGSMNIHRTEDGECLRKRHKLRNRMWRSSSHDFALND